MSHGDGRDVVTLPQSADSGNSTTLVAPAAGLYTGTWIVTRQVGVVRQLVVLASNTPSGLGGTFIFEYSEDGATPTVSETRAITDFETVRDFDLMNVGAYFRIKFTPSRALAGGEMIFISTFQRTQPDGPFVRLADQEIERANAAMGQTAAYLKVFKPNGKSANVPGSEIGNLIVADFATEVRKGNVEGHALITILGTNSDLDAATSPETIWSAGTGTSSYVEPAAAAVVSLVSTSILDDGSPVGTGAQTVFITGLDASYVEISETVTLNGVVPALTVASFLRIHSASVATAGVTASNVGTITGTIGALVVFMIQPTANMAFNAYYTVPAGKTAYLLNVALSLYQTTAGATVGCRLKHRAFGGLFAFLDFYALSVNSAGIQIGYSAPLKITEKSDFSYEAYVAAANNNLITARSDILLVDN
jgi:hypothetical protein